MTDLLRAAGADPLLLVGGRSKKDSRHVIEQLAQRAAHGAVTALATGSYLGEGFDLPGLDTLVLAFPVSFKGRVTQYVGRLLRADAAKVDIAVHDYQDPAVPVLAAMARKRMATYRRLGFTIPNTTHQPGPEAF